MLNSGYHQERTANNNLEEECERWNGDITINKGQCLYKEAWKRAIGRCDLR